MVIDRELQFKAAQANLRTETDDYIIQKAQRIAGEQRQAAGLMYASSYSIALMLELTRRLDHYRKAMASLDLHHGDEWTVVDAVDAARAYLEENLK
jgi:hypothetical protein